MSEKSASFFESETKIVSAKWKELSRDYQSKVFSATSFVDKRQAILRHTKPGIVIDLGCGSLGLMLLELAGLPQTFAIGADFCVDMLTESRRNTGGANIHYVAADNRCLPFKSASVDTVVSVNSFIPESKAEVELIFHETHRILRRNGRLVGLLPSFEMSLLARDQWGMDLQLDLENHREWDTTGWQCFYTIADIERLMSLCGFDYYRIEKVLFSAPDEMRHIRQVYAESLKDVQDASLIECPLFEHLIVAGKT